MKNSLGKNIYAFLYFLSRVAGKISRLLFSISMKLIPKEEHENKVVGSTITYNMVTSIDESYYAEQYWSVISKHLDIVADNPMIVDLGCSQGRFSIRLAKEFPHSEIVACDLSSSAIFFAREYALSQKINNINFAVQSISQFLKTIKDNSADVIIMTEVIFFYPEWEKDLPEIIRCLKPGGIVILSFRSQYFYALHIIRHKKMHNIDLLLTERSGRIIDSPATFTWQTSKEIISILESRHQLSILEICGIGLCSGIPGDPHDGISQPSKLSESEKDQLMKLEISLGQNLPDAGRYILAIARKTNA